MDVHKDSIENQLMEKFEERRDGIMSDLYIEPKKYEKLKDTVELMNSTDYKDRFKAEYYQLKIRYQNLSKMIKMYEQGELDFEPDCGIEILKEQVDHMFDYLCVLERRAIREKIDLD